MSYSKKKKLRYLGNIPSLEIGKYAHSYSVYKCDCGRKIAMISNIGYHSKECLVCQDDKIFTKDGKQDRLFGIYEQLLKGKFKRAYSETIYSTEICNKWLNSYENFKEWSIKNGYNKNMVLIFDFSTYTYRWIKPYFLIDKENVKEDLKKIFKVLTLSFAKKERKELSSQQAGFENYVHYNRTWRLMIRLFKKKDEMEIFDYLYDYKEIILIENSKEFKIRLNKLINEEFDEKYGETWEKSEFYEHDNSFRMRVSEGYETTFDGRPYEYGTDGMYIHPDDVPW